MGKNDLQQEKQKTTTATTRITKLSIGLLASVIVLSSIAAAQLFVSDNNAAFAAPDRDPCTSTDTGFTCIEAGGGRSGGAGHRETCTVDPSTEAQTCTITGGGGGNFGGPCDQEDCEDPFTGGSGGMTICTFDLSTDDDGGCSKVAGGGGSKP